MFEIEGLRRDLWDEWMRKIHAFCHGDGGFRGTEPGIVSYYTWIFQDSRPSCRIYIGRVSAYVASQGYLSEWETCGRQEKGDNFMGDLFLA